MSSVFFIVNLTFGTIEGLEDGLLIEQRRQYFSLRLARTVDLVEGYGLAIAALQETGDRLRRLAPVAAQRHDIGLSQRADDGGLI